MKKELKDQAKEILELAKNYGVEQNLLFATTFERYQTQLQILDELKATIESDGFFIDKTYVKGESNLYSHPAVTQFNRTTDSANKTVVTLMKIITTLRDRKMVANQTHCLNSCQGALNDCPSKLSICSKCGKRDYSGT